MYGLNLYDYFARHYENAIGRFTTIDPLAEKFYSISPYVYCANNPLRFIDPTGKSITTYTSAAAIGSLLNWAKGASGNEMDNDENQGGPGGPPLSYWIHDTGLSSEQQQKLGTNVLRYTTPLEDLYGLFSGKNFEGENYNRGEAGFWAGLSIIPLFKLGKLSKPIIGLTKNAAEFATKSLRADHAMRHLVKEGILKGTLNSKVLRTQWIDLVIDITGNPTKTFDFVLEGTKTKGFYKAIDGKDVVMFIAKESRGSVQAGQVIGSWVPTAARNPDIMKLIQP